MTVREHFLCYSDISNGQRTEKLRSLSHDELVEMSLLLFGIVHNLESAMCFAEGIYINPDDKVFCIDCDELYKQQKGDLT